MPTDAEVIAAVRAEERKAERKKLLSDARASLASATTALAAEDDNIADDARIAIMGTLRAAINSVHEAG